MQKYVEWTKKALVAKRQIDCLMIEASIRADLIKTQEQKIDTPDMKDETTDVIKEDTTTGNTLALNVLKIQTIIQTLIKTSCQFKHSYKI